MSEQIGRIFWIFLFNKTQFLEKLKEHALSVQPVVGFSQKAKIYMTNVPASKVDYKLREPTK